MNNTERQNLFQQVVLTLKTMSESQEVLISLAPPFEVSFAFDKDALTGYLKKTGVSKRTFRKEADRIGSLLLATLRETEKQFVEIHLKERELKGQEAASEEKILRQELDFVRQNLWTQLLQDRYDLKASGKEPGFSSTDWETKLKVRDAKLDRIEFPENILTMIKPFLAYLPTELPTTQTTNKAAPVHNEPPEKTGSTDALREATGVSDLHPRPIVEPTPPALNTYLRALRRTLWTSLASMFISSLVSIPGVCGLVEYFQNGESFLHPYLAIFLIITSIGLLILAAVSSLTAKRQTELIVKMVISRISHEP
jgi:hypothetical protein